MSFDPLGLNKPLAPAIKGYIDPSLDHDVHVSHLNTIVVQVGREKSGLEAVIAGAGEWLTSEDDKARERAALLLAELFERLPKLDIDAGKLQHIVLFLCERMHDFPSAAGSVRALLAIAVGMPNKLAALRFECDESSAMSNARSTSMFTAVAASVYVSRAMHSALHVPQLGQQLRARSFRLLSALFALDFDFEVDVAARSDKLDGETKVNVQRLRHIGPEWSRSLAAAMANEKDPRCLMVCLRLVERTLQLLPGLHGRDDIDEGTGGVDADEAPCATSAEAVFDAVACYFPITFTPPPNDPNRISPLELRAVLRGAMLACTCNGTQPAAMQWLASLLHEKMQSTHEPAKREAARYVAALATGTNAGAAVTALAALASPTPAESGGCGGDCGGGGGLAAKLSEKDGVSDGHNMLFALGEALLLQAMYGEHLAVGDTDISGASQSKADTPEKEPDEATDGGGSGALALQAIQALFHAASTSACATTLNEGERQVEHEGEDVEEGMSESSVGTAHGAAWRALHRAVLSPTAARLRLEARETGGMGSVQARAAARVLLAVAAAGAKKARHASIHIALPLLRAQFAARTSSSDAEGSSPATATASVADEANVWLVVGLLRAMCAADSTLNDADAGTCRALLDLLHGVLTSSGLPDMGSAVVPASSPSYSQRCTVLAVRGMELMLQCSADASSADAIVELQHRCVYRLACAVWSPGKDAAASATIDVGGVLQTRLQQDCLAALERVVEKHAVDSMSRNRLERFGRWRELRDQLIGEHVVAPAIRALEAGSASARTIVPLGALPSAFGVIAKKLLLQALDADTVARRVELLQALAAALGQLGRTAACETATMADDADGDTNTSIGTILDQFVPELCSFIAAEFSMDGDRAITAVADAVGEVTATAIAQCTRAGVGHAQTGAARQLLQCVVRTCAGTSSNNTCAAMPLLARVIASVPTPAAVTDDEVTVFSAIVDGDCANKVEQYVKFLRLLLPHATGSTAHDDACASICAAVFRAGGAETPNAPIVAGRSDAAGTIAAAHCVAAFVNKLPAGSALDAVLDELLNGNLLPQLGLTPVPIAHGTAAAAVSTHNGDINNEVNVRSASAMYSLLWVMRALVLRSHPIVPVILSRLSRLLEAVSLDQDQTRPSCSALCAAGFGMLLRDGNPPLDASERGPGTSVTRSSLLHKQRFLSYARPNLLGKLLTTNDVGSDSTSGIALSDVQQHKYSLQAFLSVVQHVPLALWMTAADWGKQSTEQSTLEGDADSPSPVSTGLMTLLLLGMRAGDAPLKAAALSVCVRLLSTSDGLLMVRGTLAKAARTFLQMAAQAPPRPVRRARARPQLVAAHSADPPSPPATASTEPLPTSSRVDALRCIELLTKLPYYLLHPHRSEIEKGLALPLDDPKRAVRQCAVIVRNTWMGANLGAAGT